MVHAKHGAIGLPCLSPWHGSTVVWWCSLPFEHAWAQFCPAWLAAGSSWAPSGTVRACAILALSGGCAGVQIIKIIRWVLRLNTTCILSAGSHQNETQLADHLLSSNKQLTSLFFGRDSWDSGVQAAQLWRGYAEAALADPRLDARAEQNCCYDDGGYVAFTWLVAWLTSVCHAAYAAASEPRLALDKADLRLKQHGALHCSEYGFPRRRCCSRAGPAADWQLTEVRKILRLMADSISLCALLLMLVYMYVYTRLLWARRSACFGSMRRYAIVFMGSPLTQKR